MRRFIFKLILFVIFSCSFVTPATAGFFTDDTLLVIDGTSYTTEDFNHWWSFMNEDDSPLPDTPDAYTDWLLLGLEAERMGLSTSPSFKRAIEVFIRSRSLMMLKYEEIDSQIVISDEVINQHYQEQFLPIWTVERLIFNDEQAALSAWQSISTGTLTVEELATGLNGFVDRKVNLMRPVGIDAGWTSLLREAEVGEVLDPVGHNKGAVLFYLTKKEMGNEEDLAGVRDSIRRKLWKQQADLRTQNLIFKLRDKYQVQIDEDRLDAIDINAADDSFTDDVVVYANKKNITEKDFMAVVRQLQVNRKGAAHAGADQEKMRQFKKETMFNILAQTVTDWAAVDRHYEQEEPFKWSYEFSFRHRLGMMLEAREFNKKSKVSDEELRSEYDENLSSFIKPASAKFYLVDETQGPIDQIWADVMTGQSFLDVTRQIPGMQAKLLEVSTGLIDPEVKPVVESLTNGETSRIFKAQGVRLIVHLVEHTPEQPLAFEQAKEQLRTNMEKKRLLQLRSEYLESLRSRSEIKVNEQQWKGIQKEHGGA